jgi:hypothetical protein
MSSNLGSSAGGTTVSLRGSGFVAGIKATLGGKPTSVTLKDMSTLILTTPALSAAHSSSSSPIRTANFVSPTRPLLRK